MFLLAKFVPFGFKTEETVKRIKVIHYKTNWPSHKFNCHCLASLPMGPSIKDGRHFLGGEGGSEIPMLQEIRR